MKLVLFQKIKEKLICLIANRKNINKINKFFSNNYKPYEIGYITKNKNKINLYNKIKW